MAMQSAENRVGVDTAGSLNWAREWRVLIQRTMSSPYVVIGRVGVQNPPQVRFAYHDDIVETFPSD